ncbi:hypothetical protein J4404_03210, partial [Candidatus Woesearchaeota archaeon]|nr:hypothetical protein [Candidatus Woesearchaeota archaeon]
MKKGLKNIVKNGLASLLAVPILSLGCGEIPNQDYLIKNSKPKIEQVDMIMSNPITNEIVNENYNYKIETDQRANCEILKAPKWIYIENNELKGKPHRISNDEVGKDSVSIKCSNNKYYDTQEFDLQIEPGIW